MTHAAASAIFSPATAGLPVVLLQGSAATADSWTGLCDYIGDRLDVTQPDLSRIRQVADLRAGAVPTLDALCEVTVEEIARIGAPVHLVGHDFGAVLALKIAAAHPGLVGSLTLIEPTAFNVIFAGFENASQTARDLTATVTNMHACLSEGDAWTAMQHFTDLMNGPETWERTSRSHRMELALRAGETLADLTAISNDRMTPFDLAGVVCPTLLVSGENTRNTLRQVASELHRTIPFVHQEIVSDAAHFPHLSDPHIVDPLVYEFLVRTNAQWQDDEITLRQAA